MLRFWSLTLTLFVFTLNIFAADIEWKPITPAELEMKASQVEPNADAEAIFWEVRLDDKKSGKLSYNHYVRVKILTERGREKYSKFDIPFTDGKKVEDVAARVIKPDGSIILLSPNDIFEREIIKSKKLKVKAKSFAIPAIEIGVIVEYQYKETFKNDSLDNERLPLQRDIPIQRLTYYIRPYNKLQVNFKNYNTHGVSFSADKDNFYVGSVKNIPSFKEEPQMPPDNESRPWLLLQYGGFNSAFSWAMFNTQIRLYFQDAVKTTKEIQKKADELTAGIASDEEKLRRIYDFTQKNIKNITFDNSLTAEQRENIKLKNANETLKTGIGNSQYVDLLFASLAKAAGIPPHLVFAGDRSQIFFHPDKYTVPSYIHPCCIAFQVDGKWKFYNPGTPYLPAGSLIWYEETVGMVAGETRWLWQDIPFTKPENSLGKRIGKFKLLEDGTLEGNVRIEYSGQRAIVRRKDYYLASADKRENEVKSEVKDRISQAEVSNAVMENIEDNSKPLIYSYQVKIPNYAQKTGKRLFLQPGFFEYGEKPRFNSSTRIHPIYFEYGWSDLDTVEIELPSNYDIESSDAPLPVSDPGKVGVLNIKITPNESKTALKYERSFQFGNNNNLLFQTKFYQNLKKIFDDFYKADTHTITLRQK